MGPKVSVTSKKRGHGEIKAENWKNYRVWSKEERCTLLRFQRTNNLAGG